MWKDGVSPSFGVWAYRMLVLSCLEMMAPHLKLILDISTVYAKGIHGSENLEKSFSPYNQQIKAIKYIYDSLRFTILYQPFLMFVKFLYFFHHEASNHVGVMELIKSDHKVCI
jgi:hypothetical protein